MPEIRIQRWSTEAFPVDRARYKERFGSRFRRVGDYTEATLLAAATILDPGVPEDVGVFLGTGLANLAAMVPMIAGIHHPTHPRCSPMAFASSVANAPAFHLAQAFELHGHNVTVSQEELSFEAALLEGVLAIQDGTCTWALVGAVDVPYPDEAAQRVRIGAEQIPGELASGVGFVLLGPTGPWRLDDVRVGRFEPLDGVEPGTTVLRGWTCQELPVPAGLVAAPAAQRLYGAASAVSVAEALDRDHRTFTHLQFHRDGIWGRIGVSR